MKQIPDSKVVFSLLHSFYIGQAIHYARTTVICTKLTLGAFLKTIFPIPHNCDGRGLVGKIEAGNFQISFEQFQQICSVLGQLSANFPIAPITVRSVLELALNLRKRIPLVPKVKAGRIAARQVQKNKSDVIIDCYI